MASRGFVALKSTGGGSSAAVGVPIAGSKGRKRPGSGRGHSALDWRVRGGPGRDHSVLMEMELDKVIDSLCTTKQSYT